MILERAAQGQKLVAYNTVSADKCVVDKWLKVSPLQWWEDGQLTALFKQSGFVQNGGKG